MYRRTNKMTTGLSKLPQKNQRRSYVKRNGYNKTIKTQHMTEYLGLDIHSEVFIIVLVIKTNSRTSLRN